MKMEDSIEISFMKIQNIGPLKMNLITGMVKN